MGELADPIAQQVVTFLLGGGALAVGTATGRFIWKWRTGRIASERDRTTSLENDRRNAIAERRDAERERDAADRKRRIALDEIARLRGLLIRNGIDPGEELDLAITARPPGRASKKGTNRT